MSGEQRTLIADEFDSFWPAESPEVGAQAAGTSEKEVEIGISLCACFGAREQVTQARP
jgi:hypothetical protein